MNLKIGPGSSAPLSVELTPVTIFVGPNNAGKSLILQELQNASCGDPENTNRHIVNNVDFFSLSDDEARAALASLRLNPKLGETVLPGHVVLGRPASPTSWNEADYLNLLKNPKEQPYNFAKGYAALVSLDIDGGRRLQLCEEQPGCDLTKTPETSFQTLFHDDVKRGRLRKVVFDAIGEFLLVDPTLLGRLRLRLSKTYPTDSRLERGLDQSAVEFHAAGRLVSDCSDGIKAFVGVLSTVFAGTPLLLFIDEPEAFLHPQLAYRLGFNLAAEWSGKKRLFAATHSAHFLIVPAHLR